ncbi:MAG TPA: hypothetical protein PLU93_05075, partial [Treponemataceae bacterium]|nr:hypothetical protein [Treponemataceae bacterium]
MKRRFRRFALFLALGLLFLPGCDLFKYERPFPDEYYSTNFIAGIGFDQFVGADDAVPALAETGSWDCAYRYASGWTTNHYDFLGLTSLGQTAGDYPSVPAGLDPTAPVYRLELDNLAIDGDFEVGNGGAWTTSGGTATWTRIQDPPSSGAYLMRLSAGSGEYIEWTPSLEAAAAGLASYRFAMNVSVTSPDEGKIFLNTEEQGTVSVDSIFVVPTSSISPFGFRFRPSTDESSFTNLRIDNARLTMSAGAVVRLRLTRTQTALTLESGIYEFSVWVREDPSVVAG